MSDELYALLGVRRMAPAAEIHAAYRRMSKTAHPDAGGDRAAFERLTLAHDVLMDSARRARYDETGQFEATAADNSQGELYLMAGQLLDEVMNAAVETGADLAAIDIVETMRMVMRDRLRKVEKARADALRINPILLKTIKRFKRKGKGNNVLAEIMAARAGKLGEIIEMTRKAEAECNALMAFLADYKFDMGTPQPQPAPTYPQLGTITPLQYRI